MFKPSHELCYLFIQSSFKQIQARIGQATGVSMSLDELVKNYDITETFGKFISDDLGSIIKEIYLEGLRYSKNSGEDCHVLIVNRFKVIEEYVRKKLTEKLSHNNEYDLNLFFVLLGKEYYEYLCFNKDYEGFTLHEQDLYLSCTV
jgi:hypothetical protein